MGEIENQMLNILEVSYDVQNRPTRNIKTFIGKFKNIAAMP